ncbi:STAS/SEC14 domain-containing protein [Roseicyclus sp. F158]|uniref:STAS/SEC14 domain-containing protein n=1 Tax=Tropicimonas omnivorans TaxID=3075590 RepID=A0ABU3DK03_9RHOB|nr:STAS/SEC14 domain-containing protein [Roseicyclus sp. F158]MDT0684049.1 STAS/SEC14 domain-containing protein [Roseicyclus sp. F158]
MFTEIETADSNVIGIACRGKLSESDLERMHGLLHERLERPGKPGFVLDLTDFDGYDGPSAMLEDLKIDTAHANDFSRVAIVGEGVLMEWGAKLADALTQAEMRNFDPAQMDAAIEWVRGS